MRLWEIGCVSRAVLGGIGLHAHLVHETELLALGHLLELLGLRLHLLHEIVEILVSTPHHLLVCLPPTSFTHSNALLTRVFYLVPSHDLGIMWLSVLLG